VEAVVASSDRAAVRVTANRTNKGASSATGPTAVAVAVVVAVGRANSKSNGEWRSSRPLRSFPR
jgi:hypothetical protein